MLIKPLHLFLLPLLAAPVLLRAQQDSPSPAGIPGCGNPATKLEISTTKTPLPAAFEPSTAVVIVVEDNSNFGSAPKPTTRVGIDGQWVGANHGNTYVRYAVDPGVHHLCASWQPQAALGLAGITTLKKMSRRSAVTSFTAQAGSVYYFRVRNVFFDTDTSQVIEIRLDPEDPDEGQLLANDRSLSSIKKRN